MTDTAGDPIAALAAATAELAGSNKELAEAIGKIDRRGRRNTWLGVVGAAIALSIGALGVVSINERNDRAEQSKQILEAIEANQGVIKACTTPGGECYDANQRRSNERLAPIISVLCDNLPPEKRRPPCPG